jgi:hypothetical protein
MNIQIHFLSRLNLNELETIASDPVCLHLILLKGFTEVDSLKYAIEQRTCNGRTSFMNMNI